MTYEEAVKTIPLGRYRHFKGNEYEVIAFQRFGCSVPIRKLRLMSRRWRS